MNYFDHLLHQVLADYANPPAPPDLEADILVRLPKPFRKQQSPGAAWIGIAASILLVLATWSLVRRNSEPLATSSTHAGFSPAIQPAPSNRRHVSQLAITPEIQKHGSPSLTRRHLQLHPIQIMEISIHSLSIPAMEIAPLAQDEGAAKTIKATTKRKQP